MIERPGPGFRYLDLSAALFDRSARQQRRCPGASAGTVSLTRAENVDVCDVDTDVNPFKVGLQAGRG